MFVSLVKCIRTALLNTIDGYNGCSTHDEVLCIPKLPLEIGSENVG